MSDSPFLVNNSLYSFFSDCTLFANGLKISNANSSFGHKSFIGTEFSSSKGPKDSWLKCQGYRFENNPAAIAAADFRSQRELNRESREIWFYGPAGVDFFTRLEIPILRSKKLLVVLNTFVFSQPNKLHIFGVPH